MEPEQKIDRHKVVFRLQNKKWMAMSIKINILKIGCHLCKYIQSYLKAEKSVKVSVPDNKGTFSESREGVTGGLLTEYIYFLPIADRNCGF